MINVILDNDEKGNSYYRYFEQEKLAHRLENVMCFRYSNNALESMIPNQILEDFKNNEMTSKARDYWFTNKTKFDEVAQGADTEPQGWDKNSLKNKLAKYYNVSDYGSIIDFW